MPELSGGRLWLVGGFAVIFGLAALAVPAVIAGGLIVRGIGEGHPSWVVLGGLTGALWSAMCVGTLRRSSATRTRSGGPPPSDPARG